MDAARYRRDGNHCSQDYAERVRVNIVRKIVGEFLCAPKHDVKNNASAPTVSRHSAQIMNEISVELFVLTYPIYPKCLWSRASIPSGGRYETVPHTLKVS